MDRRDHDLIARAIGRYQPVSHPDRGQDVVDDIVSCIANALAYESPSFDRDRFVRLAKVG